ncbi:zinc finger, C2H2 type [Ancylostoma duodenale]|uniref:Zinc finger, C2H2 type n=1 Tax=Ancylostoma duodenale TaxID=51022 RepID=A0A0C2GVU6_9BILA|nr:zinc finger, C2H2 type [Ancylostoma duodenale]
MLATPPWEAWRSPPAARLLLPSPLPMRTIVEQSDDECISVRNCSHQRQRLLSPGPIIDRRSDAVDGRACASIEILTKYDPSKRLIAILIVENVMRHVENALSKEREKKPASNTPRQSESSENDRDRKEKDRKERSPGRSSKRRKATRASPTYSDSESSRSSRSRSRSPRRSRRKRRRTPPKKRARSSSSSSRGTYDDFDFVLPEDECPFACRQCHRGFYTIKELAEHEIRAHDMKIPCAHCDKNAVSITKLAAHMLFRHPAMEVVCHYCDQKFGGPADKLDKPAWDDFRGHVYKEILKKKMYEHSSKASGASSDAVALRGVGRCPHGAAVKCKNFPNCPGAKCIYSHGQCRYDITCNKSTCPFDHSNRPRVCMACINDMKMCENLLTYVVCETYVIIGSELAANRKPKEENVVDLERSKFHRFS